MDSKQAEETILGLSIMLTSAIFLSDETNA